LQKGYPDEVKYSPEQIVKFLREVEGKLASGKTVEEVCREIGVSDVTYYNWRKSYANGIGVITGEDRRR